MISCDFVLIPVGSYRSTCKNRADVAIVDFFMQIASAELSSALPRDILSALTDNDKEERLQEESMNTNLLKLTETVSSQCFHNSYTYISIRIWL